MDAHMPVRRAVVALAVLIAVIVSACQLPPATSTTLSVGATSISQGQPLALTAQVSSSGGTPVGTVTFLDSGAFLGSAPVVGGGASLTVSTLSVGSHQLAASFSGAGWGPSGTAATTVTVTVPTGRYHLALGDSLAAGAGAPAGQGYVPRITAHEVARVSTLTLRNISCGGATTSTMLNGGGSCSYAEGTQLAAAEAFLLSHPGQVSFITIDIGANDVTGCISAAGVDAACAQARLATVQANLTQILARLHTAAPGVPTFGMTYYNPFLAYWIAGNQTAAVQSDQALTSFNTLLTTTFQAAGAQVAPVAVAFDSSNFALTGTYNSVTVPQNVANVCAWTRMCTNADIHANATGHQLIATQFFALIDATPIS
jgi:lysophospholipase L1-like esterase